MVVFLTTPVGSGHVHGFVKRFDRSWGRELVEMTYADLFRRKQAATGCAYLFTDRERMSPPFRRLAGSLWKALEESGEPVRLLNNPMAQLGRYELLRELARTGVNDFNAYLLSDMESETPQFPVFLRIEDDHSGPKSGLLESWDALEREIRRLLLSGIAAEKILVIEYMEVAESDGVRRKYGAVRIGDQVIGQHILFSRNWIVKAEDSLREREFTDESDDYFLENPHAEQLQPIFETAKIEFGRMDYSLKDGKIQVWEINDNPLIATGRHRRLSSVQKGPRFYEAFGRLSEGLETGSAVSFNLDALDWPGEVAR